MTHRHPQAPPGHFEVHIVLNPTADRAAAHHSHVSKRSDCMLQLEFGLIDEEYMFFYVGVYLIATDPHISPLQRAQNPHFLAPTNSSSRSCFALLCPCPWCEHFCSVLINGEKQSWTWSKHGSQFHCTEGHILVCFRNHFVVCTLDPLPFFLRDWVIDSLLHALRMVSEAAGLKILFLILVTDLPPSIALGMEPGERTGAGAHNSWSKPVIWMWAYDFAACT